MVAIIQILCYNPGYINGFRRRGITVINLKHIPAILAIVREGSITAASKKLFISQPALSQTVRNVEAELGSPVFQREGGRLVLTYAGQLYIDAGQQIQDIDRNLHARVADDKSVVYGEFRLGISTQRGLQLLPVVIPDFVRQYPHVRISLCEEGSTRLERMINEGECDVAFITTTSKRNRLHYVLIENEQLVLLAAKTTDLAQRYPDGSTIDITDAKDECFVSMSEGHSVRKTQDRLFEENSIQPNILLETHNMEAAKAVAARANAVFLVPHVYVPDSMPDRARVHIYHVSNAHYERHFYFCYRQGMYLTSYQKDLVRIVCDKLHVSCNLQEEEI